MAIYKNRVIQVDNEFIVVCSLPDYKVLGRLRYSQPEYERKVKQVAKKWGVPKENIEDCRDV